MEYLKGTSPVVEFVLPNSDTIISSAVFETEDYSTGLIIDESAESARVQLPYLDGDGSYKLTWEFLINGQVYTRVDIIDVVTPYLNDKELYAIFEGETPEKRAEVESAVRHIINSYCGQSFGYSKKTIIVNGQGQDGLKLPEHLLKITGLATLESTLNPEGAIIAGEGWYLKKKWLEETGKLYNEAPYWGVGERPGGIIYAPGGTNRPTEWERDYPFTVTGEWGYYSVPEPVKQAAKLLVNDYACMEIAYRDRYLESIKAADWRLQFNDNAWARTGNVRADQLLSDYIILDWAVL